MEQATLNAISVVAVLAFIFLMIWSKLQNQRIIDTLNEIRDILVDKPQEVIEHVRQPI